MQEDDFYVTLPSNGASEIYPRNRSTCYRTQLNNSTTLLTNWEVGLSQIQFTHDWNYSTPTFTFVAWIGKYDREFEKTDDEEYALCELEERLSDIGIAHVTDTKVDIGGKLTPINVDTRLVTVPGHDQWRQVDEFGKEVAKLIQIAFAASNNRVFVSYERTATNTTVFRATSSRAKALHSDLYIGISSEEDKLFEILGMHPRRESSRLPNEKLKLYLFEERNPIPRKNGFTNIEDICVYSDVCEEQIIGSKVGKLLKLVPVRVGKGKRQYSVYERPAYVRVSPTSLENIEIQLCDLAGNEIQNWKQNSLVTVVLHFRRCRWT